MKEIKLGQKIISEDALKFKVVYNGETFTLQYPSPIIRSMIEAEISRKLGGFARNTFDATHLAFIEATAYVDNLIVREESPEWFKSAWTCYDEACIGALYNGYLNFRGTFQTRLNAGELEKTGK